MIPYGRHDINSSDVDAVIKVLQSEWLTQGPVVPNFERAIAEYCGAKYSVAANSATSSLHLACMALDLQPCDSVWTSPITFVASANCARYCGARVEFVDIDSRTYNICPTKLRSRLIAAREAGTLPKILIAVHFSGQPCAMQEIGSLSKEFGFKIIEDASHAIGAEYKDEKIGSCRYSDITVFSFHPVKIVTTAEGGVALTNQIELATKMSILRTHGISRDNAVMQNPMHGPWYYEQLTLGFNYRMSDIHAALGLNQMQRLDEFVTKRRFLANRYDQMLSGLALTTPWQHPHGNSSRHLYVIRLDLANTRCSHLCFVEKLRDKGVGVNLHYIPVYRHPYYKKLGYKPHLFPEAEQYYKEAISLPLFNALTEKEQDYIVETIEALI